MAHSQPPTAALLYSPQSRDPSLLHLLGQIRADPVLSKGIRFISVDSPYVRNLLQGNESGVTVKEWPVFVVKREKERAPTIYPVGSSEKVFELVRSASPRLFSKSERSSLTKESSEERSSPIAKSVEEKPPLIRKSVEERSSLIKGSSEEKPPLLQRRPHFEIRTPREPIKKETSRLISWDSDFFSEGPVSMVVSEGTSVRFVSNDDLVHDVTLTDSDWKPVRRLIPRQKKMNQELVIDRQLLKTIERGRCHLISSLPQDRQMRLVLRLLNPIDEIIDGMSEADPPSRKEVAPPDRNFTPRRTWKFITDEPNDWSSSPEKSGSDGLRTNPLVARVRVPPVEKSTSSMKEKARTTFAQRRLAKLQ